MTDPRDPTTKDAAVPSLVGQSPPTPASTSLSNTGTGGTTSSNTTSSNAAELLVSSELGEQQRSLKVHLNHLTLHEERARIDVVREVYGSVTINKVVTERQELVPVMLRTEKLEITIAPGAGEVLIDGVALEPGRTHEVLLLEERATIQKEVFPSLDVQIWKESRVVDQSQTVSLRREVLEVIDPMGLAHESSQTEAAVSNDKNRS
ncbi:YsnF/AvaK domain-containing protein [Deinococcus sp. QL22]|uniref:YsnF/AvaK domain-containing protein n=1 Tax=Deinococcus sp. QL22 TaxID=2939437 RepID=UPI00201749C0|nr:YsnF/AvaK domain-containing protein [Deinococcus sp. QL22]UQN10001.1 YsnF/AvaK domain-containing protein [Deinococcus sp. QL22]